MYKVQDLGNINRTSFISMLGRIIIEECSNSQVSHMVQKDTGTMVLKSDNSPNRALDNNIPLIQVPSNFFNQEKCCFSHIPMLESRLKMYQIILFLPQYFEVDFPAPFYSTSKTEDWKLARVSKIEKSLY